MLRRRPDAHLLIQNLLSQGQPLASCPITITEVYAGMRASEEKATRALMRSLVFLPVTSEMAEHMPDILKRVTRDEGKCCQFKTLQSPRCRSPMTARS